MVAVVPYGSSWPEEFTVLGSALRAVLGDLALAIHHIGSTSVPGLAAKDVIDVQVTVASLDAPLREPLGSLGYRLSEHIDRDHLPPNMEFAPEELRKRLYKMSGRAVNLHVREQGRFNQRYALLFRDFLRASPAAASAYGEVKRQLARYFPEDLDAYYDIKDPVCDVVMAGASAWAERAGWKLPPSDA